MKKVILIFTCLLFSLALFGYEQRILFVGPSGCSGNWILYETSTGGITGYGTFDFCRIANNDGEPNVVITQGKDDDFVATQPVVYGRSLPTMEEVKDVKKHAPNLKLSPNPIKNGLLKGQINNEVSLENVQYEIIGFDGRKYSDGKISLNSGQFIIPTDNLPQGTYFILLGSSELKEIYNSNFVVIK